MDTRDEQLRKSAQMRAALTAFFNTHDAVQLGDIKTALDGLIRELNYKDYQLYSVLKTMVDNKILTTRRVGTANEYTKAKPNDPIDITTKKVTRAVTLGLVYPPVAAKMAVAQVASIKVYVRDTTRIEVGGVIVDIEVLK